MDSLTQAILGAVVGETTLGHRVGRKAALWGAALGTLPDLDVLAYPWWDAVQRLTWHRSATHSLLVLTLLSPAVGLILHKLHKANSSAPK